MKTFFKCTWKKDIIGDLPVLQKNHGNCADTKNGLNVVIIIDENGY